MKKFFKLIIALVIIVGVAAGAYFIFGGKTDNTQIYTKINSLNKLEEFEKVNDTVVDMVQRINANDENTKAIKAYLTTYVKVLDNYELLNEEIIEKGALMNNANTGSNFRKMNAAYENVVGTYTNVSEYLARTYWLSKSQDYIINFYNIFSDAIISINDFYYNAGMAYLTATTASITTNNLYKLDFECYLIFCNEYVEAYINNSENIETVLQYVKNKETDVDNNNFDKYVENLDIYNNLYSKNVNRQELVKQYISGEIDSYINSIQNEDQKSGATSYYNLIVK